jgi:hypothetical protein
MNVIQINPVITIDGGLQRCETLEADLFGVYLSEFDPDAEGYAGCYQWVADFAQRGHAIRFAQHLAAQHGYTLEDNT